MSRRSGLEELEMSGEEAARLAEAFRDPQFRALFAEYAAELADPAQRALYEAEVAALERERGVEARFLHPEPGWVLRTSQAGRRRCYVNICSHPLVGRPRALREPGGSTWRLPHCLAPAREELRRPPRPRRLLYDVLFHPDALRLAARCARLRRLLEDTALEALETHFRAGLDRANAVALRGVRYKGAPQATLLRTPLPGGPPEPPEDDDAGPSPLPPFRTPYAYPPPAPEETRPPAAAPEATTPRWSLKQRSYVDLQDFRCCRDSAPSPVPRELQVTVELPLLSSAAQAQLEVRARELRLDSQRPAYRLRLRLPYAVDEGRGRAAFHTATRQLLVTLPVLPRPGPGLADGGAEPPLPPGPASPADQAPEPVPSLALPEPALCPPFCCTQDEESLTLLLQVPGIAPQSLAGEVGAHHYRVGFSSSDSASYTLLLQFLPGDTLVPPETGVSVSRDNAVIGLAKSPDSARLWTKLHFGVRGDDLKERWLLTEDNVVGFLGNLTAASCPNQSTVELQPLVEVLDVSEGRSQIRLKGDEQHGTEHGEADATVGPAKTDCDPESGRELPAKADGHLLPTTGASGSLGAGETMGRAGWESGHCSELNPGGPNLLIPGKSQISTLSHESEPACPTSKEATSTTQAPLGGGEPAKREGEEGPSQWAGSQGGSEGSAAPPVLRETDMRDGSVQLICQHSTHCTVTFQNPLLYELD